MGTEHRMSKVSVQLTDKDGRGLANTKVRFTLKNHEFLFGCGAFDALIAAEDKPFGAPDREPPKGFPGREFFEGRMNKWFKVFNYGTVPFYWGGFEPKEGEPQTENRMKAAQYLKKNGATPKGHPLCWHTVCADWLLKYDNKTIMDKQLERINRDVTAFKGVVDIWDVINETVIMPEFDKYDNAITRICNAYGRLNLIKEVFAAAKAANPDALLLINDFNLSDSYVKVIDECLNAGVPIGAIGLQSHQHQGYRGTEYFEDVIKRFSVFGLPLHFTENTLVSGHIMPADIVDLNDYKVDEWPTTPEGEERQAREWETMYRLLFESPAVEAVTGWDFADGAWLGAPSGLVRKDGSEKPSYWKLHELIHSTWTTDVELETDAEGRVELEGYRGEYEVSVGDKKGNVVLKKSTKSGSTDIERCSIG